MPQRFSSVLGIAVILLVAYGFSRDRKAIRWRGVIMGLILQAGFAVAILGIPALGIRGVFRVIFELLNWLVTSLVGFTAAGSRFVFGPLAEIQQPWGFVFAFRALPSMIFFSALMAGLYHLGVLQKVVRGFAFVMQKTMRTSGAETLSASANIFIGQTEAPMLVRPFLAKMTRSEIYCVMVGGMATIAAGVEGAYIGMLQGRIADIAGHLLTASTMGAVGGLVISKIIVPETESPLTATNIQHSTDLQVTDMPKTDEPKVDANFIEAISRGASDGVVLALNVAGMLIAFVALIAMLDAVIAQLGVWAQISQPLSFAFLLGSICRPVAWLIGVPWDEATQVGRLLGEKVVLNEFVAYTHLSQVAGLLSDRTVLIASYALCGFANFSSIGIQIGGIGGMAPLQKSNIARLGLLAVLGGNLACLLSACIAGLIF